MLKLELYNDTYDKNLTISAGKGLPPITVNKRSMASLDFSEYQKDEMFLNTLTSYTLRGYLRVIFAGKTLTVKNLEDIKGVGVSALYEGKDASSFATLADTPNGYDGSALKLVRVNKDSTGLEYVSMDEYIPVIRAIVSSSMAKTAKGLFNAPDPVKTPDAELDSLRSNVKMSRVVFKVSIAVLALNIAILIAVALLAVSTIQF